MHLDLLPSLRSSSCHDPSSSVLNPAHPGLSTPARHFARSGFSSFICACSKTGTAISPRSSARSDPLASPWGTACAGLVFLPFVADKTYLGPSPPPRSRACFGSAVLALRFAKLEALAPLRSLGQSGAAAPTLSFAEPEFFLFLRCSSKLGAPVPLSGSSKAGFVSFPLVIDLLQLDPLPFPQSYAQLGLLLSTADSLCLGFLLSLRSMACLGLLLPVLASAASGSFMLLQAMSYADSFLPMVGMSRPGLVSSLPVVGGLHLGPSPFPHSPGQIDVLVPLPGPTELDMPVALRRPSCSGASTPAWNIARAGLAPSVPGKVQLDPLSLSRSRGRMGLAAFVSAFAHVDASVALQTSSCPGPVTLATGLSRLGLCFSPLAVERVSLGVFLFLQSPVRPDPAVVVSAFAHVGFVAPPRGFQCVGLTVPACGLARLASTPLVLGGSNADFPAFLRSFA